MVLKIIRCHLNTCCRSDLIPNVVNAVKGAAKYEEETLQVVVDARSKVGSIQATPELINDPNAFRKIRQTQGEMSSALQRLMPIMERYPELKATEQFRDLRAQLEGTENRIKVTRIRYIEAVKEYTIIVRQFPSNITASLFCFSVKPSFTFEDEKAISKPPEVKF